MLCARKWQTEWVVLDDGFQHLSLKREIDILLLPGHRPFGSGKLLPWGLLREPIKEMKRADIILITHSERLDPSGQKDLAEEIHQRVPSIPIFFSEHKPIILWRYPDKKGLPSFLAGRETTPGLLWTGRARIPDLQPETTPGRSGQAGSISGSSLLSGERQKVPGKLEPLLTGRSVGHYRKRCLKVGEMGSEPICRSWS